MDRLGCASPNLPRRPGDELRPCRGPGREVDDGMLNGSYRLLSGTSSSPFVSPNGRRDILASSTPCTRESDIDFRHFPTRLPL